MKRPCRLKTKAGLLGLMLFVCIKLAASLLMAQETDDAVAFEIKGFEVAGNTLLNDEAVKQVMRPFIGPEKTALDVEKARDALEKRFHLAGYPAVLVNIPEQTVEDGFVRLQVIESKIGRVRVTGNRYFTRQKILEELPSFREGEILYVPKIQDELAWANRNPDLKVAPVLSPGRDLGTIDVELKVEDKLPLHGYMEVNNRNTHDTTDLRVNTMLRYDNLWQRDHSASLQYQTSPEDRDEVQAIAGSYVFPSLLAEDHLIALYGIWSDSGTAFGEGFEVIGKGNIFGIRYVMPLGPKGLYSHNLTLGLDYKDFDEALGFADEDEGIQTPITYLPLSFAYSASLPGKTGVTRFSGGLNMAFRGLVTDPREFEEKGFQARGNYLYGTAGIERTQKLPKGLGLFVKLDGQMASQPLISNEQYSAGGMESVRGYKESESLGDHALHGTVEFSWQGLAGLLGVSGKYAFTPYAFYDYAKLWIVEPLPEQEESVTLQGTGIGVRGNITRHVEYKVDWGVALKDTDRTEKYDHRVYFSVKGEF